MMNLNWIETEYEYPQIDLSAETYFEDYVNMQEPIYEYGFQTIKEMKELLSKRAGSCFSSSEISEIVKTTFRNKPAYQTTLEGPDNRQIVDFIYQF